MLGKWQCKQNVRGSTVATTRCVSCPNFPLPQSTSTKEALPVCIVQKDGAGAGEEDRERQRDAWTTRPRGYVKVASWLQELLHKAPPRSFLSAFLIINFLHALEGSWVTCSFPKSSGFPKPGPGIQGSLLVLGWRLAGWSLWLGDATPALLPFGLRADPVIHSWLTGAL